MKKFFVSAGFIAIGATALESVMADDTSSVANSATSPRYWSVGATLRGFYDDNYDITGTKKGSFGVEFSPTISFHEPLKQTDMGIRYTYGLYYYEDRDHIGVNPFDQSHQVDVWLDHAFNERWHANVTDTFAVGQEPELLNPNPVSGVAAPYRVNGDNYSNHGGIVLNTEWSRLFGTTLTYNNGWYDYQNGGAITESDGNGGLQLVTPGSQSGYSLAGILDRVEESVSLDLNWHVLPETTLLLGYQFSWVNYTGNEPIAVINNNGPFGMPFVYHSSDRDEDTHTVYLGVQQQFSPNVSANIRAGGSYTDVYADPLFPSTSFSPYADISVTYTYVPGSYLQFGFTQDVSSTDQVQPNSSGKLTQYANDSVLYLDINHRITPKLVASLIGRIQYSTFEGGQASSQDETDYGVGLNLTYQISQHFAVDLGYNFDDIVTQISGYAYDRNRVYIGLTANY